METFICPDKTCRRKFSRRFNLNRHYQNFHLNNELVEKCILCGQLFEDCEHLQKHYKRFHRPNKKFILKESAFNRKFVTYRYNYSNKSEINFASAQTEVKDLLYDKILSEAVQKTVCKTSLIFICEMVMIDHAGQKMTTCAIPFRSSGFLTSANSPKTLKKNISKSFLVQSQALEDFMKSGSGWVFSHPIAFDIEIAAVRPITTGSAIDLTPKINLKNFKQQQFLFNPCNKDEKCFLYCVAKYLYADRISKTDKRPDEKKYKKFIKKFDTTGISFPISITGIKNFLKKNKNLNIKINILYRNTRNKIYPIEYGLGEGNKIINLLMVEKKNSNHFLLIENVNKYLRKIYKTNGKTTYKKDFFCLHCLNSFSSEEILKNHELICSINKPKTEVTPKEGDRHQIIKFRNFEKMHRSEYTAYLDFECVLPDVNSFCEICQRLSCKCDASFTDVIAKQKPIAFSFLVLGPEKKIIHEYSFAGENAHEHLIQHLLDQEKIWVKNLLNTEKEMTMTKKDILDYEKQTQCYLCDKTFSDFVVKVRDHSHFTSNYLGAACQSCNLRRRTPLTIPIFMHNGSRYDLHFIVKALAKFGDKIEKLKVLAYNGENFRTLTFNSFRFIDSLAFLQASLAQLGSDLKTTNHDYAILKQTSLVLTDKIFDNKKFEMILDKSFFPYEYCKSLKQMYSVKKLPKMKHFYSCLNEKTISKTDHTFAKNVWKTFQCRNLVDYTLIYCKIDVLILSEVFESFRDEMINFSGLDPAQYISLPSYSYDSMLKISKAVIDLPTDINIVQFLESGKRGGMSFIGTRYLSPSEKNNETDSEIAYIDANNLYGNAQLSKLPTGTYSWLDEEELKDFDINKINLEGKYGYFIECDLTYPKNLHKSHQNLPLAPEILEVNFDCLSPYAKNALLESNNQKKYKDVKLMATFQDRINYVVHCKNLKLYLDLGMKLKKIHRVLKFRQKKIFKPYIEKCTEARQKATNKFHMDQYKKLVG